MNCPPGSTARMVSLQARDGHTLRAHLAEPRTTGEFGGIVLLHEIFGINSYMRQMADIFAAEGFLAIVPDLFGRQEEDVELGYGGADFAHAIELRDDLDLDAVVLDIEAAVSYLHGGPAGNGRVAALGYCLGGGLAVLAAADTAVVTAVSYYGVGVQDRLELADRVAVPVIFHFAEQDHYCPPEARAAIENAFAGAVFHHYPAVGHAFATYGRDTFDQAATDLAFVRTVEHLRRTLSPHPVSPGG